eukprot:Trichotokara_eunicae@DN4661_c0_g1_i1.p1
MFVAGNTSSGSPQGYRGGGGGGGSYLKSSNSLPLGHAKPQQMNMMPQHQLSHGLSHGLSQHGVSSHGVSQHGVSSQRGFQMSSTTVNASSTSMYIPSGTSQVYVLTGGGQPLYDPHRVPCFEAMVEVRISGYLERLNRQLGRA